MPTYKLIYRSTDQQEHVYYKHGIDESAVAINFRPLIRIDGEFVPLQGKLIEVVELVTVKIFQLDERNYSYIKNLAMLRGLATEKSTGAYCLQVSGKGDWFLEPPFAELRILTSWFDD